MATPRPNFTKLVIHKMSMDAVPAGGGIAEAVEFISTLKEHARERIQKAQTWVQQAIDVVKTAPDNPYGTDDEAIAGAILAKIEERKQVRKDTNP